MLAGGHRRPKAGVFECNIAAAAASATLSKVISHKQPPNSRLASLVEDCTIKIPDWVTMLNGLASELSLSPPAFETVTSQGNTFVSLTIEHPNTPSSFISSPYPTGPRTPEFLAAGRREVSRKAFFSLNGTDPNSVSISDDRGEESEAHLLRVAFSPLTRLRLRRAHAPGSPDLQAAPD